HLQQSTMDSDVISTFPQIDGIDAEPIQNEAIHTKVSTSMFLLQEHGQPPQLAMGQRVFPIQNPDSKLYVAAYGVESLGFTMDVTRLIGRHSIPAEWSSEKVEHYLKIPDDPRYKALSDIIVRKIDPRFVSDDIVKALYIKSYLEKNGYYTLKIRHIDATDPTASFLFGSMRGYCVHFAHAAVYLLRSQGIAARVAQGYAVDNRMRGTNSAVLILGNQAHAWPEIYVDGVGWVTFDIFPENGDEPPREFVDRDLESLFGELARDDKSGGKAPESIDEAWVVPWKTIWISLGILFALFIGGCYIRKSYILRVGASRCSRVEQCYRPLRGAIFMAAMFGDKWYRCDTLESFIVQRYGESSAMYQLFMLADEAKLGENVPNPSPKQVQDLYVKALYEVRAKSTLGRRIWGYLNPFVIYKRF
ncbi:MAG: transglutaminase domain-containing protein, partial [Proteobacteria bacterium]|nr:transglutaminase domain-containing protein [Pseudomonadota bacterium]